MSNEAKIYWLTRLDGINGLFIWLSILIGFFIVLIIFSSQASKDFDEFKTGEELKQRIETRKKFTSKIGFLTFLCIFSILVSIFLPTKNEAILITAGGKTMDFIQNDTSINKIPSQTTAIISNFLEKQLTKCDTLK